ncbi:PIN-like domain-containing protein [Ulvibacter sp. MAR_2010_11]|uniref:PIN-like domain-containing protein n=1 Tax=Ulvibacter sp. MAR_2010_11 TaxID=1250229 RepID=UPI000C2BD8FE|nr:PIN-like domain-containing protein [Ulvibacter sp. MAR_2010_11]
MMKELYSGYSKKTEKELKELWKNSLITFDTNVILNLYRYSDSTRVAILELIKKFEKQIFLAYQVGLEYNRNRYEIISDQENSHNDFLKKLKIIEDDLNSKDSPPFLSDSLHNSLSKVFNNVEKEVKEHIESFLKMPENDEIFNKIDKLFNGKITEKFDEERIKQIYQEGKLRFDKKIPPGYEDHKKPEETRYGDLIFWLQILEKSKAEKKSIILISDERKEDWIWKLKNGKTIGPRQELLEEMKTFSGKDFHIYSTERFLNFGQMYLQENVNDKAIKEIENIKKSDLDAQIRELQKLSESAILKSQERQKTYYQRIEKYLEQLTPREADVFRLNAGIGSQDAMSLREIAELFDLSPSMVSKIKNNAVEKLRKISDNDKLID